MPGASEHHADLRLRRENERFESWGIYFGDVCVGRLRHANGLGMSMHWAWACGFYPGCDIRTQMTTGTEDTFDEAKAAFACAWEKLQPQLTSAMLDEWRAQQAFTRWKYAMWDAHHLMPTQNTDGVSTCFCGATITTATVCSHIADAHPW